MSDAAAVFTSVFVCAAGLSIAAVYFARRVLVYYTGDILCREVESRHDKRRRHRRSLGMVLVAVISLATPLGINYLDPMRFPLQFAYYWIVVVLLLVWLFALALADIRYTLLQYRRHFEPHKPVQGSLEDYLKTYRKSSSVRQNQKEPE